MSAQFIRWFRRDRRPSHRLTRGAFPALERLEARSLLSGVAFAPAIAYPAGSEPFSVAVGDLNGDGKGDVAVINYHDDNVSVMMSTGGGQLAARVNYAVGDGPRSVAIGDFNGDGRTDLVTANGGGNSVSVLLNSGNGTFAVKTDYAVGTIPQSVTVGDINGDGKADLAVANCYDILSTGTVSVLLGNGDGTFQAQNQYAAGCYPNSVAVGDVNGDGRMDLVAANFGDNTVTVLLNTGSGFTRVNDIDDVPVANAPLSVAAADLNGDGLADLASTSHYNVVSVLLSKGDGTFARADYAVGYNPYSVIAGDLNGDGKADLATANLFDDTVSVLLNRGNGTFDPKSDFRVGDGPSSVAVGDVSGDGMADLVTANSYVNSISVLRNTTVPTRLLGEVAGDIRALRLQGQVTRSLLSKVNAALAALQRGNRTATRNVIRATVQELEALVRARKLDRGVARSLIDDLLAAAAAV